MKDKEEAKTLDQCVEEVLKNKRLEPRFRLWKFRLKLGTLTHETKVKIVTDAGYILVQEAKYQLKKK